MVCRRLYKFSADNSPKSKRLQLMVILNSPALPSRKRDERAGEKTMISYFCMAFCKLSSIFARNSSVVRKP
jgi:hypothetical protein